VEICCYEGCTFNDYGAEILSCTSNSNYYCSVHFPINEIAEPTEWEFDVATQVRNKKYWPTAEIKKIDETIKSFLGNGGYCIKGLVHPGPFDISDISLEKVEFLGCQFHGPCQFSGKNIDRLMFNNVFFLGGRRVMELNVKKGLLFRSCTFQQDVHVERCVITLEGSINKKHRASFVIGKCNFEDSIYISDTIVEDGRLDFWGTSVKGLVSLKNLDLEGLEFGVPAYFEESRRRMDEVHCGNIKNVGSTSFANRLLISSTDFSTFSFGEAPDFHGTALHPDTRFPESDKFPDRSSAFASSRYRTLRLEMEGRRDRAAEGMFFALEQESMKNAGSGSSFAKFFSFNNWYGMLAGYGQLPQRTLKIMAWLIVFWWCVYVAMRSNCIPTDSSCRFDSSLLWNAGAFVVKQTFSPFSAWRGVAPLEALTVSPLLIQTLATLQSIVSTALFALFLLALRWRFKRG